MAYQTRQRDPLLDSSMQAALEKRGKELVGIALVLVGLAVLALMYSYTPEDPSWFSATDEAVQNWLGQTGAAIAAPMFMIVGWGGLGIAVLFLAWGLRFSFHRGQDRALGRLIFAPIAVALLAIYASSLEPPADWTHSFGLGGIFGDTAMSIALTIVPVGAATGIKLLSLVIAAALVMLGLFVLGFTWGEVKGGVRFLGLSLVLAYAMLLRMLGRGASAAASGAASLHARQAQAREERAARREADPVLDDDDEMPEPNSAAERVAAVIRARRAAAEEEEAQRAVAEPPLTAAPHREPATDEEPKSLLGRLRKRAEPEAADDAADEGGEDRIRGKISDIIKSRVRAPLTATPREEAPRVEPTLRNRRPEPLIYKPAPAPAPKPSLEAAPEPEADDDAVEDFASREMPEPELVDGPAPKLDNPVFVRREAPAPTPAPQADSPRVQQPLRRTVEPSRRAVAESQPALQFDEGGQDYETPPLSLLTNPAGIERHHLSDEALEENARMLENVLDDYGVKGEIVSVRPGPVVTMYELEPAPGLKASRVIGLADDIARSMSALSARVSTVPGRSVIGIELPNDKREMVVLREMLASRDFGDGNQKLPLALGKSIGGDPIIANLAKMPHLLIAGTTGSGKSVAINTMILSLLYKLTPDECRLIMIDPKMLELSVYDGIPHLLSPVVTDPKKAVVALKWTVAEMEDRYRKMSKMGVRNIEGYNGRVKEALAKGETFSRTVQTGFDDETGDPVFETEEITPEAMPYIVVIVDEMADLMMVAGKEIEACIQRLAQMARASGIHLIMATQRPSVDVITGTIKANFPTRISFQVTGKIDSRTILGEQGAEQLLGMGDMLYMAGGAKITRVHGPFVSDEEVEEIVTHLKQFGPPDYKSGVVEGPDEDSESSIDAVLGLNTGGNSDTEDALYDTAVHIVAKDRKCSTSYIQRKLAIGYNKAARLVEQMEDEGVVSPANHVGKREVLVPEP
ncbi:FtsK/SpoIIIE family protein [Oceanicola granulosus HTCC2516]|uniref:DNA translocase FtsK n=1 Tax=Oceanicola granulosus (strain ATCC BAA-861 / DSM 15982 / KCTC 12143 / HTCC2516) TaxID=314256 RepID=Q2CAJ8_OCEGH|nr:DNA translocase FtsK [Oceanicola granulosus]EAR49715.1 FtsK/SpoIIIE family protein [Oceanicola granulosus HTCC2516]